MTTMFKIFSLSLVLSSTGFAADSKNPAPVKPIPDKAVPSVKADLDRLCGIIKSAKKSNPADPALQAVGLSDKANQDIHNPKVLNLLQAMSSVDPSEKYNLLIRFARDENKLKGWDCPAFKTFGK